MLIGGFAVIARGVNRLTTDIDVVVRGDEAQPARLLAALARHRIEPRIERAEEFARASLVLLLVDRDTEVPVDLSFGWSDFEREALARRTNVMLEGVDLPVATADDLVIYKVVAGRVKDVMDVEELLLLHRIDVRRVRSHVGDLAELAEAPEMVERLERIVKNRRGR